MDDRQKEELRAWAVGKGVGSHRRTCPVCSAGRTKNKAAVLVVTNDGEKIMWHCWHCPDERGAMRVEPPKERQSSNKPDFWEAFKPEPRREQPRNKAVKFIGHALDPMSRLFLKSRGISEQTATLFGCAAAVAYFPDIKRETPAIAFLYDPARKDPGHKVRSTEDKAHVVDRQLSSLFGLQLVDMTESKDFLITEGELDAMALYEAGIQNATSVPNGAQSFAKVDGAEEKATLSFLWTAKKQIDAAKRVLIATDMDEDGNRIAEELARRIGRHRCWRVRFDEKDANDQLLRRGKASLVQCVEQAEPWPVEGLYEATQYIPEVYELFQTGMGQRIETGMTPVDTLYAPQPGLLTVITGIPGHGKSTFVDQMMINQARKYGHTFAICSFENPPKVHIAKLAEMLLQKHFFQSNLPGPRMTMEELQSVMPFITKHFKFLYSDDGKKQTIESIVERVKTAVFRWGVNGVVIDPYNYIQRPGKAESETVWIDDMLTQLKLLAQAHDVHIWFVAHPTKLPMDGNGRYQAPRGYSISGSAAWYSKPDFGLTIHCPDPARPSLVNVICWKVRFKWLGKEGEVAILYDTQTNVYLADVIGDLPPMSEFDRAVRYQDLGEEDYKGRYN